MRNSLYNAQLIRLEKFRYHLYHLYLLQDFDHHQFLLAKLNLEVDHYFRHLIKPTRQMACTTFYKMNLLDHQSTRLFMVDLQRHKIR